MGSEKRNIALKGSILYTLYEALSKTPNLDEVWLSGLTEGKLIHEIRLWAKSINFKVHRSITIGNPKADKFIFKYLARHLDDCYKFIKQKYTIVADTANIGENLIKDIYLTK